MRYFRYFGACMISKYESLLFESPVLHHHSKPYKGLSLSLAPTAEDLESTLHSFSLRSWLRWARDRQFDSIHIKTASSEKREFLLSEPKNHVPPHPATTDPISPSPDFYFDQADPPKASHSMSFVKHAGIVGKNVEDYISSV